MVCLNKVLVKVYYMAECTLVCLTCWISQILVLHSKSHFAPSYFLNTGYGGDINHTGIISFILPTKAAVSMQRDSAGTLLVLITTSSFPSCESWNWTSLGATTRITRSVSMSACSVSSSPVSRRTIRRILFPFPSAGTSAASLKNYFRIYSNKIHEQGLNLLKLKVNDGDKKLSYYSY